MLLTAGPYLPVYLEAYNERIDHIRVTSTIVDDLASAKVSISIGTSNSASSSSATVRVTDGDGEQVHSSVVQFGQQGKLTVEFHVTSPRLWWCNGLGSPHLYTASFSLMASDGAHLDGTSTRFGIRRIELIQRPLDSKPGKTFMFRVNGKDIFAQGANWIPADNLLPTITPKRYFDWIRLVQHGNMNMIRVWGGGVYETEAFLDACDEMGILVWLDYALANGDYPLHEEFLESISREAEVQTARVQNRACLALLCGGNEDFLMFDWLRFVQPSENHFFLYPWS